jgi:SAM-dependent methyltransferase
MSAEVIWHDVECGAYEADLPLWEELADQLGAEEAIMELGCGTGRVTLHLARRGAYLVIGIERDRDLVEALWERAIGTNGDAEYEDVRTLYPLGTHFALVLAPMQLIQLLGGREDRIACLSCVADCLAPNGRAAFAIVEELPPPPPEDAQPPLPDVHQVEGWIYSSLPIEAAAVEGSIVIRRLRQTVSPTGELSEQLHEVELRMLSADTLEEEAAEVGLRPLGRRSIPATEAHIGSTVVLFGKEV